jgi:hypothetical protein
LLGTLVVSFALASTASADLGRVVALGDSLASGTRLGPQVPGSILACGQTTGSYPELAMSRVKHGTWVNATCNGGHAGVFSSSWSGLPQNPPYQYNDGTTIPPQYNSLNGSEQLVIIGSGGNEAHYGEVMQACMGHSADYNANTCTSTYGANGAGLLTFTQSSKTTMAQVLDTVHTKSPNAKILLVGTPRIAPPDGAGCWPNPILTLADAPVWTVWEDSLRQAMIDDVSTRSSYASYVDSASASGNAHSMCAASTMRWMNPWTVENIQYPGLALHNTPWGADAMADLIVKSIKNLGLSTGTPNAPTLTRTSPTASPTSSTSQTFTYSGAAGSTFKCRLDNAAYAPCSASPVTITGVANGTHTYSVTQTDASNNVSPAATIDWTVDSVAPVAPTVTRTSPTVTPTSSPTQTITYAGLESGGTFQCKLDGAAYLPCSASPVTLTDLTTGNHTFSVTQTDGAGNVGAVKSVTWAVDVTAPNAPTVTRTNPTANPTNSTTQVITYSGAEAGGTFQCKLDSGSYGACSGSPVTLTGQTAGTHTYSVTQTDAVGNVGSATTVTWVIDTTPPGLPTVTRTNPTTSPTNSSSQALTYSGAEAGGTFQCKLDSGSYGACPASPVTLPSLGGGSHAYSVTQTDAAGNVSPVAAVSWTVDITPPPTPIVSGPSGTTALNTATISYSDSEAGVDFKCKIDAAAYNDCLDSPISLNGVGNGPHTYSVTATDAAGNTSAAGTASWTVDPSGFTVSITANPSNPSTTRSASFSFTSLITAGTTYQCKLDAAAFTNCSSPQTYSNLGDGSHTFVVHASNGSTTPSTTPDVSRTWIVDATPPAAPTLSRTSPTVSPTNSTSQTLSLTAAEAGGVLNCSADGASALTCPSSPITLTGLGNGAHSFTVTQTDAAGNTGSAATVSWTVDITPPSAPTVTRTNPTASSTSSTSQVITYTGLEAGASTQCKLDTAAFGPCSASPLTFPNLGEGSHTLLVTQTDTAGNTSPAGAVSWNVDSIAPGAPTLIRESPTVSPSNLGSQTLSYSGAEGGGTFKCKLDTGAYLNCAASPFTLSSLSDGPHTYSVTQTDATGNTSAPASVAWDIDTVAPVAPASLGFNRSAVTNYDSVEITYVQPEAGGTMECSMDSGAWNPCPASPVTLTNLDDGNHNYAVRQVDAAGNLGAGRQVSWLVDTVAPDTPTVTLTSPTSSPTTQTSATITFTAGELGGTVQCKFDGGSYGACPASPVNFTNLGLGAHTYSVRQTDTAGNVSLVGTASWNIGPDTTPPGTPTVTRTVPTENPTTSTSQTITYSGAESGGTFQCKLDGNGYAPCGSSPINGTGLANGSHTYSVTQTDSSGNVSAAGSVTWLIDNIAPAPPTVTRTSPTANPTPSISQTLTYSGEAGGTFQCRLDAGSYGPCLISPIALPALANGSHTYFVTQTDATGNVSAAGSVTWVVDNIAPNAPTVTRFSPTANPTTSTSQTISFSGEAGGTFQCKTDSVGYLPCASSPVTLTSLSTGVHTYAVTQTDAAGNVSDETSVNWTIGTGPAAPTVTRTSPSANPTTSTSQTITWSGTAGNTAQCKLDGASYQACPASPLTLNNLPNGSHTYSVTQTDIEGNVSPVVSVTWIVDTIAPNAPTLTRSAPSANPTNSTTQSIGFVGAETGGTFQCKLDSASYGPCASSPISLPSLGNGLHTYSITQTDAAGNVGAVGTTTWTVDTLAPVAPTVTRTSPTANPTSSTTQTFTISGEAGGTFQCKLDSGGFTPCAASPFTLTAFSSGNHSFSVTQTDAAGNLGSATTITWTVDTIAPAAPTVTRTSPTANPTTSTSQTISFSGELGGTYQCKLDSGSTGPCPSSPATLGPLSGGSHTYAVTQTDAAGNVSAAGSVTWTIGTGPAQPTVSRTSPTTSPTNSTTQTISYSGITGTTFQCKLDGAAYGPCPSSPVTLSPLSDGTHTYSVTQTDAESNVSPVGSVTWTVDTVAPTPPTVTRTAPTANPTNVTAQSLSYSGAENGGTFKCKLDGAAYDDCPISPLTLIGIPDGAHTYSVTQTDAAGNVSAAGTATWTIDTVGPIAPTVTLSSPTDNPTTATTQQISFSGEAGGTYDCKLDSEPIAACSGNPVTLDDLSLGLHTFLVRQTDTAGNTGAVGVITWTVVDVLPEPTAPVGPTEPVAPDKPAPVAPVIPSAKLTTLKPKTIVPAKKGVSPFSLKAKNTVGSFRVTLNTAATISVRLERIVPGATRTSSSWTKFKLKSGKTTIFLTGRSNGRPLAAGTYKVHLTVSGVKQSVFSQTFKIKR